MGPPVLGTLYSASALSCCCPKQNSDKIFPQLESLYLNLDSCGVRHLLQPSLLPRTWNDI